MACSIMLSPYSVAAAWQYNEKALSWLYGITCIILGVQRSGKSTLVHAEEEETFSIAVRGVYASTVDEGK